ncbi:MAG TPA: MBL fold metallo-hydrolase, partial [bacterium]|nr:MBL fold metallo-hydrolase [bacterium]
PLGVAPGIRARFIEAGHILGSSSIQLLADEDGREKRIVFSGDLGPRGAPIMRDFESFHDADLVVMESTYGDRNHRPFEETVEQLIAIMEEAVAGKGKILVPTFAVGRAQTLLAVLAWIFRSGRVEPFPVFLDSPMAVEATRIYRRHPELFDEELKGLLREQLSRDDLATLRATVRTEESMAINDRPGPCLVLAGSGMCTGGRILHHLRHNLWKPETHVLIVGYQGRGTLGRLLVEGSKRVTIFGEPIAVKARIHTLGGFSSHAGQEDLLAWFDALAPARPRLVLTHGEDHAREALAARIRERHGIEALLVEEGATV